MSKYLDVYLDGIKLSKVISVSTHCGYGEVVVASVDSDGKCFLNDDNVTLATTKLHGHIFTEEIK